METMPVVILWGRNTGPTGGREEGRKGGGPLVKPICTSDALSIPRTADNFTGLYLRCLEPKGGEGRRSAYPNSFTYFPLSRKYIRVLSLLSPPSPPLVSWLFHFFSLFLSFFFFFGFSITIAVTFSEFFSTFSLSSFRFLEIGIYRSILCEVCEFFFYYFCLFETRYFKFVKFISNRWNSSLLSGRRVNFLNAREREERFVRERTKRCETSFRTDKMQLPFGCHVTVRTASRKPLNLVFLVLLLCRFEHLSLSKTRVKKFLTNCSASTILYIYMIIKFTYIYNLYL